MKMLVLGVAILVSVAGITVMLAWVAHVPAVIQFRRTMTPVQFNTPAPEGR